MTNKDRLIQSMSNILCFHRNYLFDSYSAITEELERIKDSNNILVGLERFFMVGDEDHSDFCEAMSEIMETKNRSYEDVLSDLYVNSDLKCEMTRFLKSAGKKENLSNDFAVCLARSCLKKFHMDAIEAAIIASEILSDKYDNPEYEDAA